MLCAHFVIVFNAPTTRELSYGGLSEKCPCIKSPIKNPASLAKPGQARLGRLSRSLAKLTRKMRPGQVWQTCLRPSFLGNLGHKSPAFSAMLIPRPDFLGSLGQKKNLASLVTKILAILGFLGFLGIEK